jgi:hypothetical protein
MPKGRRVRVQGYRLNDSAPRRFQGDAMKIGKQDIERRTIIEAYARYDCSKTGRAVPAFATWDWSQADVIDREMACAHLKVGVPAGYLLWDEVEVTVLDLYECAVDANVFPGQSRKLGHVDAVVLADWKPNHSTQWYEGVTRGRTFDEAAPMLLRPAVRQESPARWYIEDGSGRAIAFVANQHIFGSSQTLAIGYLGRKPDPHSSFMQEKFPELLC